MLLLIEGSDKNGKTHLAQEFANQLGWDYHHEGPPPLDPAEYYLEQLLRIKNPTVMDRSFIGEEVYGPLLRGGSSITNTELTTIYRVAQGLNAVVFHCEQPKHIRQAWYEKSKDELMNHDTNEQATLSFRNAMIKVRRFL